MQKTIASVYWRECNATRPYLPIDRSCGYGSYPFHLAAAAPGAVSTFVVPDMLERQYIIDKTHMDTPVFADDPKGDGGGIANDLVNEWSRNTLGPGGDAKPGVFVCAGTEPTDDEVRQAIEGQLRLCEWRILKAEDNWLNGKRGEVTDADRDSARWYLAQCELEQRPIPQAFVGLEWISVKPGQKAETVDCPMCFKKADARAIMCPDGHVLDFDRYQQYISRKAAIEGQAPPSIPMPNPRQPSAA